MKTTAHSHRCDRCGQEFACEGAEFTNYDGDPLVVCEWFHVRAMTLCASCEAWLEGDGDLVGDAIEDRSAV
jgi:hypothetical protein